MGYAFGVGYATKTPLDAFIELFYLKCIKKEPFHGKVFNFVNCKSVILCNSYGYKSTLTEHDSDCISFRRGYNQFKLDVIDWIKRNKELLIIYKERVELENALEHLKRDLKYLTIDIKKIVKERGDIFLDYID